MSLIRQKAEDIAKDVEIATIGEEIESFLTLVLTIISIIVGMISIYQNCHKTPEKVLKGLQQSRFFDKLVEHEISKHDIGTVSKEKLKLAIIKNLKGSSQDDVKTMFSEAPKMINE